MNRVFSRFDLTLLVLAAFIPVLLSAETTAATPPLLLQCPSLSQDKIAFLYADDI